MGAKQFVINALADYNLVFTLAEAMKFRRSICAHIPVSPFGNRRLAIRCLLRSRPQVAVLDCSAIARGVLPAPEHTYPGRRGGWNESGAHPPTPAIASAGARLVLCIHDEVLVEAPTDRAEEVKAVVEKAMIEGMESFITAVPIVVEARICSSWEEPQSERDLTGDSTSVARAHRIHHLSK